ncbi:hypothetical protein T02_15297, partial [Trichinella nativa]
LVKIYRRPKRATQLIRLMFLHYAQMIITRSCPYSYRFSSLTQSTEPAENKALLQRTTEQICSNVYIHSDFSIDIDLVQNREAVEKKCISSGYRKIASVNHVDVFVGPTRECEAWQKIIRRLRWRCVTKVQVQNATFSIFNLHKPAFTATCAVSVFYANWTV